MKKIAGDIIILQMCNKNHNHMMYVALLISSDVNSVLNGKTIIHHYVNFAFLFRVYFTQTTF